jgi:hypothetical protein
VGAGQTGSAPEAAHAMFLLPQFLLHSFLATLLLQLLEKQKWNGTDGKKKEKKNEYFNHIEVEVVRKFTVNMQKLFG